MLALLGSIFPATLKEWVYGGLLVAVVGGFAWYTLHERNLGKQQIEQQDAALALREQKHVTQVETSAATAIATLSDSYNAALAAPPSSTAPHLIVCNSTTPRAESVPSATGAPSGAHAATNVPAAVPQTGIDIGPTDDKLHQACDAQVTGLQAYIAACVAAKLCK